MLTIPVRLISKNVRYATKTPSKGEEPWSKRVYYLANELQFNIMHNSSVFICCQEVLHEQLQDIISRLGDEWTYVGWGRDDGKKKGEYSPIIYRKNVWQLLESNPVWFSPTPGKPSQDPEAACIRILTRAKFQHCITGILVVIYCTHLDHKSSPSRTRAAAQIHKLAKEDSPNTILLAGDFNSEMHEEAYQAIVHGGVFHDLSKSSPFHYGNEYTFTGFESKEGDKSRIDYIFCNSTTNHEPSVQVQSYAVLNNRFDDGVYNSDHRAIIADFTLRVG